jgi:hypothetical protein
VLDAGHALGIAGEGALSDEEGVVVPLNEGAAYFALRAHVPLVPVGIVGTRWLRLGKVVRLVVGEPIQTVGMRADRAAVDLLTARLQEELGRLVAGPYDDRIPGPVGRFITDVFTNDQGRGRRGHVPWNGRVPTVAATIRASDTSTREIDELDRPLG